MTLRFSAACLALAAAAAPCNADGTVILDFNQNRADYVTHLRVAPDDSIRVQVSEGGILPLAGSICGLFGMDADGTLVATFGNQGRLSIGECAKDFGVRADGSLDVLDEAGLHLQFRDANGTLLSTSGQIFPAVTDPGYRSGARALLRQSNGKFMVGGFAGTCFTCDPGDLDWAAARLNADGSVDTSFAGGFIRKPSTRQLRTLVELPNGKVLAAGRALEFGNVTELSQFDATGLDFTYGLNARVVVEFGVGRIAVDASGRSYVVGAHGELVRLNVDGNVDGTFAATTPTNSLNIDNVLVDSMGRVLLFGVINTGQVSQAYIARYTSTGAPDTTFNGNGVVTFSFPQPMAALPSSAFPGTCTGALQSQDRALIACIVENVNGGDFAIARLTAAGQLDTTFGATQVDTDRYPDAFAFADVSAPYGAVNVVSAPATISGFDAGSETTASVSGDARLAINCDGNWVTSGFIEVGETLCVRQNASVTPGGTADSTVTVGGRQATFTVLSTNTAADSIPDAFAFTAQTGVARDTVVTSNIITIQGITGYSTATATNGAFSVDCTGPFVTSSTFITNGTQLCVRHTSSSQFATSVTTTLSVGGVSSSFSSTTVAAAPPPAPPSGGGGGGGGGGALDELLLATLGLGLALSLWSRIPRRR